ncbi:MAG: acyl-CoA dehydrogenase [Desulfatibacillaceae bacterium]
MAQVMADRRDIEFALWEQLEVDGLAKYDKYAEFNKKTCDLIINEARNFALKELLPINAEGDREGVRLENGQVKVPECFRRPFELLREGEWTSMTEDPEVGGQGVHMPLSIAVNEYLMGGNYCLVNYGMFGHGTGKMIELYGTDRQKELFLEKLYTAEWGGTMLLTEAEAGSDVGNLTTTATRNEDGTYSITGQKIFITNGDHDLTDNIIHPVLARIEGAPAGTRGISIFIVPKYWVNDDGSIGEPNDVECVGIEEKMGIHASATCTLDLGGKGKCRGLLLGEENKGMRIMFHMMNEARLIVGFQAFTYASSAYLYALEYARQRKQGRDIMAGKDPDAPQVPIIAHPDVRRMLLWMKAHVEGMRSFFYLTSYCIAMAKVADTEEDREYYEGLVALFTPLNKAYAAQRGYEVIVQAMQVYGGYGYIREYPIEQLLRDCKITSIYEGTDGIQAMDLLGRKLAMNKGRHFMDFLAEVSKAVARAKEYERLGGIAEKVEAAAEKLGRTAMVIGGALGEGKVKGAFAHAFPFMMAMGDVIMAWQLLWRATVAEKALAGKARAKDKAFYEGQVKSAEFFAYTVLPRTLGGMDGIQAMQPTAVEIEDASFGG